MVESGVTEVFMFAEGVDRNVSFSLVLYNLALVEFIVLSSTLCITINIITTNALTDLNNPAVCLSLRFPFCFVAPISTDVYGWNQTDIIRSYNGTSEAHYRKKKQSHLQATQDLYNCMIDGKK